MVEVADESLLALRVPLCPCVPVYRRGSWLPCQNALADRSDVTSEPMPGYFFSGDAFEGARSFFGDVFLQIHIVLLDSNPLEDIENTQTIWRVIKGGWLFDPEKLQTPELDGTTR